MEQYLDVLGRCPLFFGVGAGEMRPLLDCLGAAVRPYKKNGFVLLAGDEAQPVGVVLSGGVHIVREDYWGNRTLIAHIAPGGLFGEAFALAGAANMPVSAVAAEDSEVLIIGGGRMINTCTSACAFHLTMVRNMTKLLAQKNIALTEKMEILAHRTTRARLMGYLSAQAKLAGQGRFQIPFNRQQLADYLSVDRSAMSAELSKMQAEGLIKTKKNHFEILDR